jgi:glycosyltransferase involved in cell wall biosynthesis
MDSAPRILYVANVDWFFASHRLPLAKAVLERGADVTVAAADTGLGESLRRQGFRFVPLALSRKGTNPIGDLKLLRSLLRLYRETAPDLVHQITIKPILYGSIAARRTRPRAVVNAVSGLGYSFSSGHRARHIRPLVKMLYRIALRTEFSRTIFQNPDDQDDFVRMRLVAADRAVMIRGSGVDCAAFRPAPEPGAPATVILSGRMLVHKGVDIFVEAARLLGGSGNAIRFVLVGPVDPDHPAALGEEQIRSWVDQGLVEWWGNRSDMPEVLAQSHVVVLPSTVREGLPKALLEAAAAGRPVIASDLPGCREIVRHDVNGLLVPPGDSEALARAIERLVGSPETRTRFGTAGRGIVEREFAIEIVVKQTLDLYRSMLGGGWPPE